MSGAQTLYTTVRFYCHAKILENGSSERKYDLHIDIPR